MRTIKYIMGSLSLLFILAFTTSDPSGVRGTVKPPESGPTVILINGQDSIRATPVNGFFTIPARPGIFQLLVDGLPGYRDFLLERVVVEEGVTTDVGDLVLEKNPP